MKQLLILILAVGLLVAKDSNVSATQKIKTFELMASKGDFISQTVLGGTYLFGNKDLNIKVNYAKAYKYLNDCAKHNTSDIKAKKYLSICYYSLGSLYKSVLPINLTNFVSEDGKVDFNGIKNLDMKKKNKFVEKYIYPKVGLKPDRFGQNGNSDKATKYIFKKAEYYLKKADEMGFADATQDLSNLYLQGSCFIVNCAVDPDYKKALYYVKKLYNDKDPINSAKGAFMLGSYYVDGVAVLKDYDMAKKYLKIAVEKKIPNARCVLGMVYAEQQKYDKAKILLKEGYEDGESVCKQFWDKYNIGAY